MKKLYALITILVLLAVTYSGAWFFMAHKINQSIGQFYAAEAPAMGVNFYVVEPPTVKGFPFAPSVTILKGFWTAGYDVSFPKLTLKGFPIPGMTMSLKVDENFQLFNNKTGKVIRYNEISTKLITPKSFPKTQLTPHLKEWQEDVGAIDFTEIYLEQGELKILAKGPIGLDDNLQPTLVLDSTINGYENIVKFFLSTGDLKPLPAALAISALKNIEKQDPVTNEKYVQFDIKIIDRKLSIGPVTLVKIPAVSWPGK